jgi:hypothetical protein
MVNTYKVQDSSTFDITPDVHLIQSIGQKGYQFWQAISELIDNAIDAKVEHKKPLLIEISFGPKEGREIKYVEVRDYGKGMTYIELEKCMRLAYVDPKSRNNSKRLGKFGLGLKTAASSIGAKFSIKTKHYESSSDEILSITYDEPKFLKNNKWEIEPSREKDNSFAHGTLIRIESLEERGTRIYLQKVDRMLEMLSMQYGPYIRSGELKIISDTLEKKTPQRTVEPYEYELYNNEKHPLNFQVVGKNVSGWVGFATHGHKGLSKGFFGFNLFWKNRLVGLHKKIGFRPHAETWRLVGELHLDDFPVTNDKKDFIWSHVLMQELVGPEMPSEPEGSFDYKKGILFKEVEKVLEKFEHHKKERRAVKNEIDSAVESQKLPLIEAKKLKKALDNGLETPDIIKKELNAKIAQIAKLEEEKNILKDALGNNGTKDETKENEDKKPDIEHQERRTITSTTGKQLKEEPQYHFTSPVFEFRIEDQKYTVYHELKTINEDSEYLIDTSVDDKIVVISNDHHHAITRSSDLNAVYDRHRIEAIALCILNLRDKEKSIDNFMELRNVLYKEYYKQRDTLEKKKRLEEERRKLESESESSF